MTNTISNMDDTIDSRDVVERIETLQEDDNLSVEDADELKILLALQDEAEGYSPDWQYGATLIRESYFEQAMDEMIADCYELPKDLPFWMTISYDYDALKQDYTEVDFGGVTYLVRSN